MNDGQRLLFKHGRTDWQRWNGGTSQVRGCDANEGMTGWGYPIGDEALAEWGCSFTHSFTPSLRLVPTSIPTTIMGWGKEAIGWQTEGSILRLDPHRHATGLE